MGARRRTLALVAACATLVVAGCGEDEDTEATDTGAADTGEAEATGFDVGDVELRLMETLSDSGGAAPDASPTPPSQPPVIVTSVDCPDDATGEAGETFDCELGGADGLTGTVTVTLSEEEGAFRYEGTLETQSLTQEVSGEVSGSGP